MEVRARLKNARIGTMKIRHIIDMVRGRDVNEALEVLTFLNKKGALIVKKLIESAVANAEQKKVIDIDNLFIKTVFADQGPTIKRWIPRAQGRAAPIKKKMSHINLVLDER